VFKKSPKNCYFPLIFFQFLKNVSESRTSFCFALQKIVTSYIGMDFDRLSTNIKKNIYCTVILYIILEGTCVYSKLFFPKYFFVAEICFSIHQIKCQTSRKLTLNKLTTNCCKIISKVHIPRTT
jgi:hypothetical protein